MTTLNLGALSFPFKGNHDNGTTYKKNDLVHYSPHVYVYINNTPSAGNLPTDNNYWSIWAQGVAGTGAGDMLSSNNLNDVENPETALSNLGIPKSTHDATSAPTVNHDSTQGYSEGSSIIVPNDSALWICFGATEGGADWRKVSGALAALDALPDNSVTANKIAPNTIMNANLRPHAEGVPNGDWNEIDRSGIWMASNTVNNPLGSDSRWWIGQTWSHNSLYVTQEVWDFTDANPEIYRRYKHNGTWLGWSSADQTTGSRVVTALNGHALTAATVAGDDKIILQDSDDANNLKTATAQQIADLAAGGSSGAPDQLCKAWVNFNGRNTVSIRDSYNVSSVVDNGTGDYTINFETPMANANYCVVGMCQHDAAAGADTNSHVALHRTSAAITASSCRVVTGINTSSTPNDATTVCVAIYAGD